MSRRGWMVAGMTVLVLGGVVTFAQGAWIQAKAWLAQHLLEQAWVDTRSDGAAHKAWPWADHWPVARLRVARAGVDLIVLSGDAGNSLAFAPGHAPRSGLPGDGRTVVLSGHRDTHFRFLRELAPGMPLSLESARGAVDYRGRELRIVDSRTTSIDVDAPGERLLLVTCYPFDALVPGGPLRYVVVADPEPAEMLM